MREQQRPSAASTTGTLLLVLAAIAGLVGSFVVGREASDRLAAALYSLTEGREVLTVVLTMVLALGVLLAGLALLHRFRGRTVGTWAGGLVLFVLFVLTMSAIPGKHDNGERSARYDDAIGTYGAGDLFVGIGWALLPLLPVTAIVLATGIAERRTRAWVVRGGVLATLWLGLGALVVTLVDAPVPRSAWLPGTAAHLKEGEAFYDDWEPGLDADLASVVSCDTAAEALRLDGRTPDLDGCREALLVHAAGRTGPRRTTTGELSAVVVRVRSAGDLAGLDEALDGVALVAAHGLPGTPERPPLVTQARAALSLVIAAEDPGTIPRPTTGAAAVPLTRALAYTLIGEAQGFHLIPDVPLD